MQPTTLVPSLHVTVSEHLYHPLPADVMLLDIEDPNPLADVVPAVPVFRLNQAFAPFVRLANAPTDTRTKSCDPLFRYTETVTGDVVGAVADVAPVVHAVPAEPSVANQEPDAPE